MTKETDQNRPDQVHITFPTLIEEKVNLPQSRQMAPLFFHLYGRGLDGTLQYRVLLPERRVMRCRATVDTSILQGVVLVIESTLNLVAEAIGVLSAITTNISIPASVSVTASGALTNLAQGSVMWLPGNRFNLREAGGLLCRANAKNWALPFIALS